MIDAAIKKAKLVPRDKALKYVVRQTSSRRPVFVVTFDPRLPSIPAIQQKHWRAMITMDPYMREVFPEPPLTAYKRQKNIKDYIVKAKVPQPNQREKEKLKE